MGNCLSLIISDIIMSDLQNKLLPTLPYQIIFYKRYVDDILIAIPNDKLDLTLNIFNSYHPDLQFTLETEHNNYISFLDIKVIHMPDNSILTDWYLKPTHSGRYLNYYSVSPFQYKINVIKNLIHRSTHISSPQFHNKNLKIIKQFLLNNNYPSSLINKIINTTTINSNNNSNNNNNDGINIQPPNFFSIPYIPTLSEKIKNIFKSENVQISFKNHNSIYKNFFSKLKEKNEKLQNSKLVYKIDCKNCDATYVGQTSQYLSIRLKQHSYDVQKHKKYFYPNSNLTSLVQHSSNNKHEFDFNNPSILIQEPNYFKRIFLEMVYIKKFKNSINKRTDIENLSNIYNNLIERL